MRTPQIPAHPLFLYALHLASMIGLGVLICWLFTGCRTNMPALVRELAKDPATVTVRIVYPNVFEFSRSFPTNWAQTTHGDAYWIEKLRALEGYYSSPAFRPK